MAWWLVFIVLIILYIYVSYYYRYPKDTKVLNAMFHSFNAALLYDRHPIILVDVPDMQTVKSTFFKYLPSTTFSVNEQEWHKNKYKYALIQNSEEIHLLPAYKQLTPEETLITLQMKPNYLLILPFHWHYSTSQTTEVMGVNDYVTWMLP